MNIREKSNVGNQFEIYQDFCHIVGHENATFDGNDIHPYRENVTEYRQDILGVVYPRHEKDLHKIVILANQRKLSLFPISQGKNWGYGSRLPGSSHCIVVDFSRHMNEIIEVNEDMGYAIIQPGVTQGQLADYLQSTHSDYFIDVTGSSRCSSIIGNCLERGVAFNSKRDELLLSLRILTGSGQFVNTAHDDNQLTLQPPSCQPNITSLFIQSSFGFVCLAFVRLIRRAPVTKVFNFIPHKNLNLDNFFKDLANLYNENHLNCIFHLYNAQRLGTLRIPFLGQPEWFGVGNVKGSSRTVRAAKNEIKKRLRKHGRAVFYTETLIGRLRKISPFMKHMLGLIESSVAIQQGKPRDTAVLDTFGTLKPDNEAKIFFGFIVFAFPHTDTSRFSDCFRELMAMFDNAKFGVSINLLDSYFVEAVMSIEGNREDNNEVKFLQHVMAQTIQTLIKEGFKPYRLDVNNLHRVPQNSSCKVVEGLKDMLDPCTVIASGKYSNV